MDYLIVLACWLVFHYINMESVNIHLRHVNLDVITSGVILSSYWVIVFVLSGLYKKLYLVSRLDEFFKVLKASVFGALILYLILDLSQNATFSVDRSLMIIYWGSIFIVSGLNRFLIRTVQRFYARKGKGLHRTLIIGTGHNAKVAYDDLMRNRTLGMDVMGYVQVNGQSLDPEVGIDEKLVIGHLDEIDNILEENQIQDVLVAIEPERRKDLVEVISKVDKPEITIKLLPDFHQLVSGLNKTNQIFGLPFIEISPQPMPFWERVVKRLVDISVSALGLVIGFPVFLLLAIIIMLDSEGSVIFAQKRVGRNGKPFTMYKFRTMRKDAEAKTGPMWAQENDPRVTKVGYWLRKLRLDELPQLLNVLSGSMSLVGPRPERPHFVDQFKVKIPLYSRRLRVRPGITGWAQVKWKYDSSLDDVKEKTKYDLYYVENISLKMDMKILIATVLTMIKGKGQ